jgi:hypothetical protein
MIAVSLPWLLRYHCRIDILIYRQGSDFSLGAEADLFFAKNKSASGLLLVQAGFVRVKNSLLQQINLFKDVS